MRTKARYKTVFYVSGNHTEVQIRETDERDYSKWRRKFLKSIDDEDMDDYYDPDQDVDVSCRRTNWARAMHSTCHAFHEIAMDSELYQGELEYLGRGTYRSAWLLHKENVVCKTTILPNPRRRFDAKTFTLTLTDANIMEALSASNRIADIYGYCGSSVMTESLEDTVLSDLLGGDSKDPDDESFDKTVCQNSLTLDQKLDMAIQFSEALAELQGYVGGAMMHGDFHSPQWFRSGRDMKLNDFNKGHIFTWDGSDYCFVERCYDGSYRAPEDIRCEDGNEASDTYSLGNNFYMLLTGMWPHYEFEEEDERLYELIGKGLKRPYIDPSFYNRSVVEDTLIHLMKACWEQDFMKRISVFDVVKELYRVRDVLQRKVRLQF
jgi:serine/threonine protein kinase